MSPTQALLLVWACGALTWGLMMLGLWAWQRREQRRAQREAALQEQWYARQHQLWVERLPAWAREAYDRGCRPAAEIEREARQRLGLRVEGSHMAGTTCLAYRDDGTRCRAPATILDGQRGGLVCLDHALDTYHCPTHGVRSRRRGEVRQAERDAVCLYVCRACGQVADPTPLDAVAEEPQC